ncbi:MAG: hypothetical protein CEO40_121 [Parcubacteria group bacterium LiPW_72]|nr:MAG: hypothetical protein CEO40_121 [Parcubacteria group bacterium LiPW_72]
MNFPSINNQSLISFLQKRRTLISVCIMMLIILVVGLMVIFFLNDNVLAMKDKGKETQELKVNMRLYHEVSEGMRQNEQRPVSGIGDLRNPFCGE